MFHELADQSTETSNNRTLMKLPTETLAHIVARIDAINRLSLRKVCKKLRDVVDRNPDIKTVYVTANARYIDKTPLRALLDDLEVILKNAQLRLDDLIISGGNESKTIAQWFRDNCNPENMLHTKTIELRRVPFDHALSIISVLVPGYLEKIDHHSLLKNERVHELFEMEQWKRAKEVCSYVSGTHSFPIENIFHLSRFSIGPSGFAVSDAIKIRDNGSKSQGSYDDAGTLNFAAFCGAQFGARNNKVALEGDTKSVTRGHWTEDLFCPSGFAVCGIQARVEKNETQAGIDDTGMNNVQVECCPAPYDCDASYEAKEVEKYQNNDDYETSHKVIVKSKYEGPAAADKTEQEFVAKTVNFTSCSGFSMLLKVSASRTLQAPIE